MLTRAKCLLIIIGHGPTLVENGHWKSIIDYCQENGSTLYSENAFNKEDCS